MTLGLHDRCKALISGRVHFQGPLGRRTHLRVLGAEMGLDLFMICFLSDSYKLSLNYLALGMMHGERKSNRSP